MMKMISYCTTTGGRKTDSGDNRSVTVSLDAPIGDATIGLR